MTDTAASLPESFLKGRFSLYETPSGGIHLAWRPEGSEEDQHLEVPAWMVKMASKRAGGDPAELLKALGGAR